MEGYQRAFFEFAIECGVLKFGQFTLKSGRNSPYFFNAGLFNSGEQLRRLGGFYAAALVRAGVPFDMLFGPAYKGIPLVAATAIALAGEHGRDLPFAFDRKEAKDHGEGGVIVGAPLAGRVVVVDDVISSGSSVEHSARLIGAAGATLAGVVVALDRQERGQGERSAVAEVRDRHKVPVIAVAGVAELVHYLENETKDVINASAIRDYRAKYGAE
ncbi:MAG: orotate phosphoribosyltransferase [Immundisolibacter sp.]